MATSHEVSFCSDAAGWINQELDSRPELPFSRAQIEASAKGSRKRRDLTIFDRTGKPAITGEVKLPYMAEGSSPYHERVVEDAHSKASRVGAAYFVTWNVNRIVLWQTDDAGKPLFERNLYEVPITQVRDENDLANQTVRDAIRAGLLRFIDRAGQAFTGAVPLAKRPLDVFFVTLLEAALERPIAAVVHALSQKYREDVALRRALDNWMRDSQGWPLSDDELIQRDNLERGAKFACYVLVNKIVFYKALRRRFQSLPNIRLPANLEKAELLQVALYGYFARAIKVTRDYETVFHGDFGDRLPFLADAAVPAWRDLIESIDQFDFTRINYDVIGPIFERLIGPQERHRYGQHYTKPEIVDLIEAFTIRTPDASVLDPACGGGTFLVRAYNRKKFLADRAGIVQTHDEMLDQLFGVDMSAYAAHLTTMNLATRDLIDEQNYPLVAHSDFFDALPDQMLLQVPLATGDGAKQLRPIRIGTVDAIVGNPPYVRQEEISKPPTSAAKGGGRVTAQAEKRIRKEAVTYKNRLAELANSVWDDMKPSGRSDLHVYFWPHATRFLKPGGWYGFLTSSGWLDVEYGFRLQDFILNHYRIVAIFESLAEPWFTGARVTTCATILQREDDAARRDDNVIRFVQLRSPLSEIFPSDATEEQRQLAAEALRDRIESIEENVTERHWRVRVQRQGDLRKVGHQGKSSYQGGKWGVYLRAPDFFFSLLDRFGDRLVPLSKLADVRFGLKTGCDRFFFVRDITQACVRDTPVQSEFRSKYGIWPAQTDRVRIVRAGDGSIHLIEAEYLEPEVHSLMEITSPVIHVGDLDRSVLLCSVPKSMIRRKHVLKYIEWGERERYHKITSVAGRSSTERLWYDVTDAVRPSIILPKIQQYRHIVPVNPRRWTCNSSLLAVTTKAHIGALAAVLNSSLVGLTKWFYGRPLGNEANLQLDVYSARSLPVPDVSRSTRAIRKKLQDGFKSLKSRDIPDLDEDLDSQDRRAIDDAVFELLGEQSKAQRAELVDTCHDEILRLHKTMKDKESLAMRNRAITARGGAPGIEQVAEEVVDALDPSLGRRIPEDLINDD